MLCSYLRATELAGLNDPHGDRTEAQIDAFNRLVRQTLGAAPLWLLPFPLIAGLPERLRVDDTLGRDGRGWPARATAVIAVVAVLCYAYSVFAAAVGLPLSILKQEDVGRSVSTIDLHFAAALGLFWLVGYFAITTVLPWTPPAIAGSPSKARRNLLFGLSAGYLASLPVSAIVSRGHYWLRGRIPPLAWARRVANVVLPGNPRWRDRQRWEIRWHKVSLPTDVPPGFLIQQRGTVPRATFRARYLFSPQLRLDGSRLFGAPWSELGQFRKASEPSLASLCIAGSTSCPKLAYPTISLSIEAAALDRLAANDIDGAFALLGAGIQQLGRGKPRASDSIRLYDLRAALAVRYNRLSELDAMISALDPQSSATSGIPKGHLAKFVDERASQRRRKDRRATEIEEKRYLDALWQQRITQWRDTDSRWRKKWSDPTRVWKISLGNHKARGRDEQRQGTQMPARRPRLR